jgi:hypothetical protein
MAAVLPKTWTNTFRTNSALCGFLQRKNYERTLYHHTAHTKQRFHDVGLVWAFKVAREWRQQSLATDWCHRFLMGHRLL